MAIYINGVDVTAQIGEGDIKELNIDSAGNICIKGSDDQVHEFPQGEENMNVPALHIQGVSLDFTGPVSF